VKWVFDLHNEVNKRIGKPIPDITVDDLPMLYNSFPLRYINLKTGDLLETPRYEVTEGRDCPSDEQALKKLQKQIIRRAKKKMLKDAGKEEYDEDSENDKEDEDSKEEQKEEKETPRVETSELKGDTSTMSLPVKIPFWMSPLGVSLIWLISLAVLTLMVVLVIYIIKNVQQKKKNQSQKKPKEEMETQSSTSDVSSIMK